MQRLSVQTEAVAPLAPRARKLSRAIEKLATSIVEYERVSAECNAEKRVEAAAFFRKRARDFEREKAELEAELKALTTHRCWRLLRRDK
jgi:hypothetical protein